MKKSTLIIFSLLLFGAATGQQEAANGTAFSLQQAIEYAMKNSPSQQNAEFDLENSEYRKREITGIGLPQVSGSFDMKDYLKLPVSVIDQSAFNPMAPKGTYTTITFGVKYSATAGINVSQLVFSSDYIFGLKASSEFMNLARINITRSKAEVVSQVSKAYYNVLINRERVKLLDANISRLERTYNDTKAVNEQGMVELIDVQRLEVAFNNLVTEKTKILRLLEVAEAMLKFQMGYDVSQSISLTDQINTDVSSFEDLSKAKIDISQRPDLLLIKAQQKLYDIDVKRLKYGYLPTLAAYGAFQATTSRPTANIFETDDSNPVKKWYPVGLIGVTLNLNLFDGLQRHYKIQQAKITSKKNLNTMRNIELASQLEATAASIAYDNAFRSVQVQKRNMELAQNIYDVTQKKYAAGVGNNLEVVSAEAAMKEAQTNYLNTLYDMIVARIDYQKATGTLIK
jgi:outer membrane protein